MSQLHLRFRNQTSPRRFAGAAAFALVPLALVCMGAGFEKPDPKTLRKIFGSTHVIRVAERGFLQLNAEQWNRPFISEDNGLVYVAGDGASVKAIWLASGKTLWERKDLGRIGRSMAQHGDTLIVGSDVDLVGVEGFSGKEVFKEKIGGTLGGEITIGGDVGIAPVRPNTFVAFDPKTGAQKWRQKRPVPEGITIRGQAPATIDVKNGRVFLGFSDGALMAVRANNGEAIWTLELNKRRALFPDVDAQPVLFANNTRLMAASYNGGLAVLEAETGRIVWKKEELNHITGLAAIPDSSIIVASRGENEVLGLTRSGTIRWRYRMKGVPTAPVALGDGLVVIGSGSGATAVLEVPSGRPAQIVSTGAGTNVPPAVRGPDMALISNKGMLLIYKNGGGRGTSF